MAAASDAVAAAAAALGAATGAKASWFPSCTPLLPQKGAPEFAVLSPPNPNDSLSLVRVRPPSASGVAPEEAPAAAEEDEASSPRKRAKTSKNEYQVEKILQVRHVNEEVQYLIKWKGWASKHNTWEPLSHLQNLQSDIAVFHALEKSRTDTA
mmetsp:Transcript_8435/g.24822  ORF Transcript_8435/g.24822 Transcript_8435/m.24822 type:complete len:153 (+) Transcript_8435:2-460(+)